MFLTRKELSASPQCTQSQDTPVIISSICELQETAPKGVNVEAARLMSALGHKQRHRVTSASCPLFPSMRTFVGGFACPLSANNGHRFANAIVRPTRMLMSSTKPQRFSHPW